MELESAGDVLDLCVVVWGVRYSTLVWVSGNFESWIRLWFLDGWLCVSGGRGGGLVVRLALGVVECESYVEK